MPLFPGISDEQLAAEQQYNQVQLERADRLSEAQKNRNLSLQQQEMEIGGKRDLAQDQFGYNAMLQGQQGGIEANRDEARFQHDDELYQRHLHGEIAEQHLADIQQREMALLNAGFQEQGDYRREGIDTRYLGKQQEFTAQQAKERYTEQEKRDALLQGYDLDKLSQTQGFDAQKIQWEDLQKQKAVVTKFIADAWEARHEYQQRHKDDMELADHKTAMQLQEIQAKEKNKKKEMIAKGFQDGSWELAPWADDGQGHGIIPELDRKRGLIEKGLAAHQIDQKTADKFRQQNAEEREEAVFQAAREVSVPKRAASIGAIKQKALQALPPDSPLQQLGMAAFDIDKLGQSTLSRVGVQALKVFIDAKQKAADAVQKAKPKTRTAQQLADEDLYVDTQVKKQLKEVQDAYPNQPKAYFDDLERQLRVKVRAEVEQRSGFGPQPQPEQGQGQQQQPQGGQGGQQPQGQRQPPVVNSPEDIKRLGLKSGTKVIYQGRPAWVP
jgi:hypothetical protein